MQLRRELHLLRLMILILCSEIIFLAAKIAEKTGEENKQRDSIQHSKLFEQLFSEKVLKIYLDY